MSSSSSTFTLPPINTRSTNGNSSTTATNSTNAPPPTPSSSISSRYAHMRAASFGGGAVVFNPQMQQPVRNIRTPVTGPIVLPPIRQNGGSSNEESEENNNEEATPVVPPQKHETTLLLILPGYTEPEAFIQNIKNLQRQGTSAASNEKPEEEEKENIQQPLTPSSSIITPTFTLVSNPNTSKGYIKKIVFTAELAEKFCEIITETTRARQEANSESKEDVEASGDASIAESPSSSDLLLSSPPTQSILSCGTSYALILHGPGALRTVREYLDEQEQRAYVYVAVCEEEVEKEVELLFPEAVELNPRKMAELAAAAVVSSDSSSSSIITPSGPLESTFAIIKPDAIACGYSSLILSRITQAGFTITRIEEHVRLNETQAKHFYAEHLGKQFYPLLVRFMSSGPCTVLHLTRVNAIAEWRKLVGSKSEPNSLRGLYAIDGTRNAVHGSDSPASAVRELEYIFQTLFPVSQSTLVVIKPDGIVHRDAILQRFAQEGFDMTRRVDIAKLTVDQVKAVWQNREQWCQKEQTAVKGSKAAITEVTTASSIAPVTSSSPIPLSSPSSSTSSTSTSQSTQQPTFEQFLAHIQSGPITALEYRRSSGVREARRVCGGCAEEQVNDPVLAKGMDDKCIRALGTSTLQNIIYNSPTVSTALRDCQIFFGSSQYSSIFYPPIEKICFLVKPDIVAANHTVLDSIITKITKEGFVIKRYKKLLLTPSQLHNIFPSGGGYHAVSNPDSWVSYMTSQPVMVYWMERMNGIEEMNKLVGKVEDELVPNPIDVLKATTPLSIRAQYGIDGLKDVCYFPVTSQNENQRLISLIFESWYPILESTYGMIKPDCACSKEKVDAIIQRIKEEGFEIMRKSRVHFSKEQASEFYGEHTGRIFLPGLIDFMTSGYVIGLELRKSNAIRAWRDLIGPTDSNKAREQAPNSIRALFGADGRRNACHGSDSSSSAQREIDLVFNHFVPKIETTCVMIKPEAVSEGKAGVIIERIKKEGYEILRREKIHLTSSQVQRFYGRNHAGAGYYPDLIRYISSSAVIFLECRKERAVEDMRTLIGQTDSMNARKSSPTSIRALYGRDKKYNAIHASSTIVSAKRELELVWKELSKGVEETFAWIKPPVVDAQSQQQSHLISHLEDFGFSIEKRITLTLTVSQVRQFFGEDCSEEVVKQMSSGPAIGVLLKKENAVEELKELCGTSDEFDINSIHASSSASIAQHESTLCFQHFFHPLLSNTLVLIKPDILKQNKEGEVLDMITKKGFEVVRKKVMTLTKDQLTKQLFPYDATTSTAKVVQAGVMLTPDEYSAHVAFLSSGPLIALELRKEECLKEVLRLIGTTSDPAQAKVDEPDSLRAKYGTDTIQNAVYTSESLDLATHELELLFDTFSSSSSLSQQSITCVLIKPDAVKKGVEEAIAKKLTEAGYEVLARKRMKLTLPIIKSLYPNDIAKPFFKSQCDTLMVGPSLCLALRKQNALQDLQSMIGPENPKIAKKSHPQSIRALYGTDSMKNAIHAPVDQSSNGKEVALLFGEFNFDLL